MSISVCVLKMLNKLFPLPKHPFNMQLAGEKTYAEWQFEKGEKTIDNYLAFTDKDTMFRGKKVLDVGCGAGGKSLYYAMCGAEKVTGIDILEKYAAESAALAEKLHVPNFEFRTADAAHTDFADDSFDTIIMNDAMEHVDDPSGVLREMRRILRPGGRLYINFPPYYHPYGAHLSDAIGMPWVQLFFSDKTLISAYKDLVRDLPDGAERITFRIGTDKNGKEYFSYINKMTIQKFKKLLADTELKIHLYAEIPLRGLLKPFCHGILKEVFVKAVVCVFEK